MIGSSPARTSLAPWEFAAPWGARGYVTELDGPVHWIEFGSGRAAARNPQWESVILTGVGHVPQLEVPGLVIGAITDWLDRHYGAGGTGHAATDRA